ncbi:hypothetical protein [Streptomyces sp. NPDC005732]|uniref:hypothetical protein n=1 Tax=Streptomyces sp. NPDC005732 TaxID=3157057 RepID=UPI0033CF8093
MARQDWADGSVHYQVSVDLHGDLLVVLRLYRWPQPGLRVVPDSDPEPAAGEDAAEEVVAEGSQEQPGPDAGRSDGEGRAAQS